MNNIDETALIDLVRNYPLLYDLTSPLYNDQQKKEEAWNEISLHVSASAYDCKTKWTRLRDNYRKALLLRNKNSGRSKNRAVKYEKELSFLNEKFSFTPRKRNISIVEQDPLNNQVAEPHVKLLAVDNKTKATEPSKAIKKYAADKQDKPDKQVHEINAFFEGIAETVKTFPKKIQVQLKRDIFNLVNDTEASLLSNDNSTGLIYYTINSPMVGGSDYVVKNQFIDSPSATSNTVTNEYTASSLNLLQTTDDSTNIVCDIEVKEEVM